MPAAVLISGSGTNLQSFIDAVEAGRLALDIVTVLSDRPDAYGLQRARQAGIATQVLEATADMEREQYDRRLLQALERHAPRLVLLAGFMRVLSPPFVRRFAGRMLNIHPSLLPAYRGLHTHRRVLAAGDTEHGCSIHFVTDELDGGPLIAQAVVPVQADDDEQRLSARVQEREHKLYPLVAAWFAAGRLRQREGQAWLDNEPLTQPLRFEADEEIE